MRLMNDQGTPFTMLYSALHEPGFIAALSETCSRRLHALNLAALPTGAAPGPDDDVLILLPLTGGTEQAMKSLRDTWDPAGRRPVWVLAVPYHSSLAAALEFLASLRHAGIPGRLFHFDPMAGEDEPGLHELSAALDALRAHRVMHGTRLGLIGPPSDWLLTSPPDADLVKAAWGPELVPIPTEECVRAFDAEPGGTAEAPARMYAALKALIARHRITALTIRCFDLLGARDATACLSLARLNDEGLPAGCEGDIPSALGMVWIRALWKSPVWMANPSRLDVRGNRLTLAHCTVPLSLTSGHEIRTHFESGRGTAIAGHWASEEVTVFRVGGPRLQECWIAQGLVVARGRDDNLCRTQLTVEFDSPSALPDLVARPLGNHLLVLPGKRAAALEAALAVRRQLNP